MSIKILIVGPSASGKTTTFTDIDIPAPAASFTPPPMDWTTPKSDRQYNTEIPF